MLRLFGDWSFSAWILSCSLVLSSVHWPLRVDDANVCIKIVGRGEKHRDCVCECVSVCRYFRIMYMVGFVYEGTEAPYY